MCDCDWVWVSVLFSHIMTPFGFIVLLPDWGLWVGLVGWLGWLGCLPGLGLKFQVVDLGCVIYIYTYTYVLLVIYNLHTSQIIKV